MADLILEVLIGAVIGGAVGLCLGLLVRLLSPRRECPDCGVPGLRWQWPRNARQFFRGGWTCPECGCEVDRKGRKVVNA